LGIVLNTIPYHRKLIIKYDEDLKFNYEKSKDIYDNYTKKHREFIKLNDAEDIFLKILKKIN